jgi:sugar phosphate isomerase/epimerase
MRLSFATLGCPRWTLEQIAANARAMGVEPLETTFGAIRGHIAHVHFKDAARENGKVHSKLPGTGQVDLHQALALLHGSGYKGYLSFEWEKKWEPGLADPEVAFPHYVGLVNGLMQQLGVPKG